MIGQLPADSALIHCGSPSVPRPPPLEARWPCSYIVHGCWDDPVLVEEVAAAARIGLKNERLKAEVRAQLEHRRPPRPRWRKPSAGPLEPLGVLQDLVPHHPAPPQPQKLAALAPRPGPRPRR